MKYLLRAFAIAIALMASLGSVPVQAQIVQPKTLVLYDAPAGT